MRGFSFVSYGFDTAAIRFSYGFHMAVIWISYGFDTYGIPEAYLKHAGGIPEVLLKHMDFILISYPFDTKIIHRSYINHTCGIHEPYMGHTQHRCEISLQARLLVLGELSFQIATLAIEVATLRGCLLVVFYFFKPIFSYSSIQPLLFLNQL